MHVALYMASMATGGILLTTIEETQYLIKKPGGMVREVKIRSVNFPGCRKVNAALVRHLAILLQQHMAGGIHCRNVTAKYPQTRWRRKQTGAPPPT